VRNGGHPPNIVCAIGYCFLTMDTASGRYKNHVARGDEARNGICVGNSNDSHGPPQLVRLLEEVYTS